MSGTWRCCSRCRRRPPSRRSPSWPIRSSVDDRRRTVGSRAARPPAPGDRRPVDAAVPGDGLRLPVRPVPQAVLDRVPGLGRRVGSELLRPPRVRVPPRQLPRHRQGRGHAGPLVPARPGAHTDRPWLGADLVVRVDVRVPDASARDARAGQQPARADEPAGRGPPDALRHRARRAMGHLRIWLQRP